MRRITSRSGGLVPLAVVACVSGLVTQALAQPANDSCATPQAIAGTGFFPFDNCAATTGAEGQNNTACANSPVGPAIFFDLWYCWTAPCTGIATVSTCGLTMGDSKLAVYNGCACPAPGGAGAIACDDDSCSPQGEVMFDVVCGQEYLIQIGSGIDICWQGEFLITCEGEPCPPEPGECDDCCGKAPDFTGFPGAVATVTRQGAVGGLSSLEVIDISSQGSAPIGSNWFAAPFYSLSNSTNWSWTDLGSVFGVALDDDGNIYVAHSSAYGDSFNECNGPITPGDALGMVSANAANPSGRPGSIYKVSTSTGVASFLTALPNQSDPAYVGGAYPANGSESYPGLGNICFDCATRNLYVSNHEDGRIYRLDTSGTALSTYKHATGLVGAGGAPEAGDLPGFVPMEAHPTTGRGQRVWAVATSGGRLYYSVWREQNCPTSTGVVEPVGNEVWSVDLVDSGPNAGEFIPGTEQLEIDMVNSPFIGSGPFGTSSPISDLSFSPDCCMLVGERSMTNDTISDAHESRVLEFCYDAALRAWVPSPNAFQVGENGAPNSSSGGVDYDFDTTNALVNVWSTADYINGPPTYVYGIIGLPFSGGTPATGIWVDFDQNLTFHDKWQQGDVEVSCPEPCGELNEERVDCVGGPDGWTGCYDYTFTFTNNSGVGVKYILITDPNVTPNLVTLPSVVPSGQTSGPVTVRICPDDDTLACYPLHIALADEFLEECCTIDACIELPDCDCLVLSEVSLVGPSPDLLNYSLTFTVQNMTPDVVEHVFIVPDPAGTFTISPEYVDLPTLLPNAVSGPIKIDMGTLTPGQDYCVRVSIHTQDLEECCSQVYCFTAPSSAGGWDGCPADLAEPFGQLDFSDVIAFLTAFASMDPRVDCAAPFGQFDFSDVVEFLTLFAEGCPERDR